MAVNDLRIRRGIANLLNPNGMAGSEIVDAPCVSMSLRKVVWEKSATNDHRLGEVRFLSRSPFSQYKRFKMLSKYRRVNEESSRKRLEWVKMSSTYRKKT